MTKNTNAVSQGRFVWHELHTRDVAAAKGFYGELFGWETRGVDMGPMGTYTIIQAGGKDVGGIAKVQGKSSPEWLAYCSTDDVDAAVSRAQKQGAKVEVPPTDIPNVGRFAQIVDRQGARIAPFKPNPGGPESDDAPAPGTFCWTELATQDPKDALELYKATFGWTVEEKDMGPMGTYYVLKRGDKQAGGLMKTMDPKAPSGWLAYVAVADVDKSFEKAKRLKAESCMQPMDIPGVGRFAVVKDPEGVLIALFQT
ncbi:MAG: VOC family protein [Polyangiaceae bacterium]|nr:VOC family protein [Polyangiaceae bacterium]